MTLRTEIADQIRHWRETRGLSQEQLAALAELSADTIVRIESKSGRTRTPTFNTLQKIADALGVGVKVIMGDEEQ